jgi:hypothetical protein
MRENVGRLPLPLWRQKNWMLHHDNAPSHTSFFYREYFIKKNNNNTTVVPHPPYLSLFPPLKMKIKGLHLVTNEVIEAESQAVLNTTSRMHLKKMVEAVRAVHTR